MKILLVSPMPPYATATLAVPRVLHAQLTGLTELGHEVTVAAVAGPEDAELLAVERLRSDGVDIHAVCRHEPQGMARWRRRWRLASGWLRFDKPWRTVWFYEEELQQVIRALGAERGFDVISVEDNAMGIYDYGHRAPAVLTEHEVRRPRSLRLPGRFSREWPRQLAGELDWQRWPRYQRLVWGRFPLIQTFTQRDADSIREVAPEVTGPVRVNPFGLDLPDPLRPAEPGSREILFVGNFVHHPNVDAAVWLGSEIMPRLRRLGANARLTVVGPWVPPSVAGLACDDVRVLGQVPDVRPFLENAAVVLAPIRVGGGMRMKVLEAMAVARAVVTTGRGTEGIEPARGSAVVVADSADEFAAEVDRLLADSGARASLASSARAFAVEHHSARAYARRLESVYEEVRSLRRASPAE
jgi:glycosyltransferase involved in cell wall biosynthesis